MCHHENKTLIYSAIDRPSLGRQFYCHSYRAGGISSFPAQHDPVCPKCPALGVLLPEAQSFFEVDHGLWRISDQQ